MIFFKHKVSDKDEKHVDFTAVEDGEILGECVLLLKDNFAEVTEVTFSENKSFIIEGLLKAAFNFAANRNYYIGRCSAGNVEFCVKRMDFIRTENGYENDIPSILTGSCKNCGK